MLVGDLLYKLSEKKEIFSSGDEVVRRIDRIILHGKYSRKSFDNDVALIHFEKPIKYTQFIRPICIKKKRWLQKKVAMCVVTGWGRMHNELGPTANVLQELEVG